jgi:dihydropteroate synthase
LELLAEGADIIDIGGESTRPGALPVSAEEEMQRLLPVIKELHQRTDAPISVDTSTAAVAEAAIKAGASIINDVSALSDPTMASVAASTKAGLILMHRQGTPLTMQMAPHYPNDDVVTAVTDFLSHIRSEAIAQGIASEAIVLDPGIGFGKRRNHNFELIEAIPRWSALGAPILIGHSCKSFLAEKIEQRFIPSIAVTAIARYHGAMLFRVHHPRPHREALETIEMLLS